MAPAGNPDPHAGDADRDPDAGYYLAAWSGDCVGNGPTYQLIAVSDPGSMAGCNPDTFPAFYCLQP